MRRLFLALVPLLASAIAGPIVYSDQDTCSSTCTENTNFAYVRGQTYEYNYVSDIRTSIQGASEDHATIHLTATALLEIHSKCELSLRLKNVRLTEYDPNRKAMVDVSPEFAAGLEQNSVRLSYQDGAIENVCLTNSEPTWVMNVKRGIISMLQNRMKDLQKNETVSETDVSGLCDTKYSFDKSGRNSIIVSKTKDLLACTDRHGYNSAIQGVPFTADSDIQSMPLLRSDHNCKHEIDTRNGHMKTASCQETHIFRPFSNSDSGVVTITTQTLSYVGRTTGTKSPSPITDRVTLKFEHANGIDTENQIRKDITRKLVETCEQTKSGLRPESPRLFTDLVYMMRSADKNTLSDVYRTLNEGSLCLDNKNITIKVFLDALPMAGTPATVELMTELIKQRVVTGSEAIMWIASLNFIKKPSQDMLRDVKPLINIPELEDKALLSVGTLVYRYCIHRSNCESDEVARAVVSAIVNKMAKGCKVNDANMKSTLMALRAIGNAGYVGNGMRDLETCVRNLDGPVEIRLSAIEAYRRMPCSASRSALMDVLSKPDEDSELRIAAYRMLMECPSDKILAIVKNTLAKETVNQVGSYIWTHLTNLMETSDPHKQEIKALLENEDLMKEFDLDKRKFSRNYEGSIFVDKFNTGAKFEGDLIWSQKSFIPRSAAVNLTIDLFGHSVNLLELGGRAEGLEIFMETLFGPNGYFKRPENKNEPQKTDLVLKNVDLKKIEKIDKKMGVSMADLRGSIYMRVFGNEMRYTNFHGLSDLLSGPQINIPELIIKLAEESDYSYSQSTMFLDSSFIIPTASGFPLNLTVNGTAMINLNIHGKMDIKRPPSLDISGRIAPSAAVDISSMMSVDAHVTKTGVKMVSTLHTSTAIQGKLTVDKSGAISAKYDFPGDRMEIIDFKSSFFTVHNNVQREQSMITDNKQTKAYCSPDKLSKVLGLELCAEVSYPNATSKLNAPYFPLTGPVSAGVYVNKRDTHTYYEMSAKSKHDSQQNIFHVVFNTPGSKLDRHMEVDFNLDKQALSIGLVLRSPWKQAILQGDVFRKIGDYGISGKLNIDRNAAYSIVARLKIDNEGNTLTYTPTFELEAPSIKPISIKGILSTKGFKQSDIEVDVKGLTDQPVIAKMTIHNKDKLYGMQATFEMAKDKQYAIDTTMAISTLKKKTVYNTQVSVRTPTQEVLAFGGDLGITYGEKLDFNIALDKIVDKKVTLKGVVLSQEKKRGQVLYRTDLNIDSEPADVRLIWKIDNKNFRVITNDFDLTYVIKSVARNNVKLVSKIINQSGKTLSKGKLSLNLGVKKNPEYNLKLGCDLEHNLKLSKLDLDVAYGKDFKDTSKLIDVSIETNRNMGNIWKSSADLKGKIKIPALDIATQIEADHSHDFPKHFNSSLSIKNKGKPYSASISLLDKSATSLVMYSSIRFATPKQDMEIENEIKQVTDQNDKYISTLSIQMQKDEKSVITTTYEDKPSSHKIDSVINVNGWSPITVHGEFGGSPQLIAELSYEKDSKTYRGMLKSFDDSITYEVHMEMEKPDYKGSIGLIGKVPGNMISVQADLKWGNPVEELQKTNIYAWVDIPSSDQMNGSIALKTSHRAIIFNVNHQTRGDRFVSHADFEWENNAKVEVDTSLQLAGANVLGRFHLQTPFAEIPILSVDVDHVSDSEEYNTKVNIQLDKKISVATVLKKPINLRTFVATLDLETSFKDIKKVNIFINHKMGDSLASAAKLSWNKQFVNMDVVLQNATKGMKVSYEGMIDLKTSWNALKKGLIKFSHDNNGKKFNTLASLLHNRQEYKINSSVTHLPYAKYVDNEGELTISIPLGKVETRWNHRHAENTVATTLAANIGSNRISVKLRGTLQKDISMTLLMETYREQIGYSVLNSSLIVKSDDPSMHAHFNLVSNGVILASANASYNKYPEIFKTGLSITIPDLNINSIISLEADVLDLQNPNARLVFDINPDLNMNIVASTILLNSSHWAKSSILWKTTMPGYNQVKYTYELLELPDSRGLKTISTLNYQVDKEIKLETTLYELHNLLNVSVVLTTTNPHLPRIEGGVFFSGQLETFQSGAHVEVVPYLDRNAISLNYDATSGILSSLNLTLPSLKYPVIQMAIEGNFADDFKTSQFRTKCIYGESESIIFSFNHYTDKVILVATADAVTPIGSLSASVEGKLSSFNSKIAIVDKFERNYSMDFKLHNTDKFEITTIVSTFGRRDIIGKFTHTGSPTKFNCSAELSHDRKNNFLSTISFRVTDVLTLSVAGSLRTELISNADKFDTSLYIHGSKSKIIINGEISRNNEKTSSVDFSVNADSDVDVSLSIRSPFLKSIKSSLRHIYKNNFVETQAALIYGGETKLSAFVQLSDGKTKVGEIKISTFLTEDFVSRTRIDGTWTNFNLNSEALYGNKMCMIDWTQRVDRNLLDQRITFSATGIDDISSTLSFVGDYKQLKSFAELNKGTQIHRIDVSFNNDVDIEGSVLISSPIVKPVSAVFYIKGPLTALTSHAEINIENKKSEMDIRLNTKPFDVLLSLKSPYTRDVSVTASQKGSFPSYLATTKLSIQGIEEIEAKVTIVKTDKITTTLEISPMNIKKIVMAVYLPDFTRNVTQKGGKQTLGASFMNGNEKSSIDMSCQFDKVYFLRVSLNSPFTEPMSVYLKHDGGINSFKSHADLSIGAKTSDFDIRFSSVGKTEGALKINSFLIPKLTLEFGHSGTQSSFNAYALYKYGENKTAANMTVNIDNKYQASLEISLPKRSPIIIHFTYSSDIDALTCNGEVTYGQKWEAEFRLQRTNRYQFNLFFNPPTSFMEPVKLNFSLVRFAGGLILNVEYAFGSAKSNADLAVSFLDSNMEIKTNISCEEFLAIFNVSARSIENSIDISSHAEFIISLEKTDVDFKYQLSEERYYVSIISDSPFLPEIDANLLINGMPRQFNVEGTLAIDGDLSSVKLTSDLKSKTNVEISINTPYSDEIYMSLRHTYAYPKYMVLIVNSKVNGVVRDAVFSMNLNSMDFLKLYLTINNPHFSINFSNNRTMDGRDGFVHKGFWEVYVGDKFIRVLSSIRSLDDFGFRYYLPLKNGWYVGNMEYTHNEMTTRVIILDDIQKHKIELIYNVSPELKLLIDVDWPSIPTLQSNIYLKRTQTDVTGGSSIIIDGENKGSLELNFNGDKRIASFKLDLPTYNGFEKLSGSLIKKSEKSLEMLSGSILRKGERLVEFDIKYDLKNSFVDIDISSTEPQQSSLKFKASAEKDMFKTNWVLNFIDVHKGHIEFKKGKDQYLLNFDVEDYTLKIDFHNQQGVVESEIVVNIPNRDIISCQVRYTDNLPSVVTGNVHFTWNSTMAFEFDLQLKTSSGLEGSAILKTPFPKYKYTELKGFHQGTWAQYRTSAQCTFVGKSISIAADITPIKVRVIIQTPFKYTENVEFDFFQSTGDSEYKAGMNVIYATGKELTLTVGHASKKMSMASFVAFESPFTSPLAIIANHTGTLSSDFTTIYQVKNGADSVTIEVTMKYGLQSIVCLSSLTTVFEGEISEQSFKVTHIGRLDRFKTEASVKVFGQEISLDTSFQLDPVMEASITLLTPYTNIRNLHAAFTNNYNPNSILSTGIVQWAENRKFTGRIDVVKNVLNHMTANMETSMSLTTPFEALKQTALSVSHKMSPKGLQEGLKLVYNNKVILDADLEHNILGEHKSALVFVRAPRPMKFEIDGDFTLKCVDFEMVLDWNPLNISQNINLNAGYDIRSNKVAKFNITGFGKVLSLDTIYSARTSKANVAWGLRSSQKVGYEVSLRDNTRDFKLILPTRSIALLSKHSNGKIDVDFMWNADVNPTEKVFMRSSVVQNGNYIKTDMTLGVPQLKKLFKFGTEFIVNRGRTIFDGRTEISYSADSNKTFAISCKLEDVSSDGGKNYSLIFDLSHPHTTVGINLKSHIGRSSTGYSSGLTLIYMTARRQMQPFSIGGVVDKRKQSISLEIKTPVKLISISGSAQTDDKFRLSLLNVYDNKDPLVTVFTIDRASRSIDFMINYDIDRPQNEFHIRANYVNSSALQAEVYHLVDTNHIQDVLVTVRLNTSHLIHSRIHWRPEMIKDLEAFRSKKSDEYNNRIERFVQKMMISFTEELLNKKRIIWGAVGEEIGPENAAKFEAVVMPYFDQGRSMIITLTDPMVQRVKTVLTQSRSKYSATMVSYKTFVNKPLLENIAVGDVMKADLFAGIRKNVSDKFNVLSEKLSVQRRLLQAVASNGIVWSGEKGTQVLPKMIVQKLGYLKVGTYLESHIHTLLLDIEQDIQKSLKGMEDFLLTHIRSPITIWDPVNGEIQLEQYLPIPLQSLDAMPILEYGQKVERLRNMIPDTLPSVRLPEVPSEWLPPFSGVATISKGQRITTFDGFIYDLEDKCTFVLARDFNNNNFTIVLSNEGDTTLNLITRTHSISVNVLGQVVDGDQKVTIPATIGDLSIQELNGIINIVNGEHFNIVYDTSVDHITVKISGWYFGKVAGLLGIYDNEPSNELVTSFNKIIDNSSRFAKTWTVSAASC